MEWGRKGSTILWPGKVVVPPKNLDLKRPTTLNKHCVYFFGSHDYQFMSSSKLSEFKNYSGSDKNMSKALLMAYAEVNLYKKSLE